MDFDFHPIANLMLLAHVSFYKLPFMIIRKLNYVAVIMVMLSINSCSSNNSSGGGASPIPVSIFRLNINGQSFEWLGSLFDNTTKGSKIERGGPFNNCNGGSVETYELSAQDHTSFTNNCIIGFFSGTTNLQPGVYQSTEFSGVCNINLVEFGIGQNNSLTGFPCPDLGDTFTVTVSSVSNGYASGTFNGQIRNSRTSSPMLVTGEFINVKYIQ